MQNKSYFDTFFRTFCEKNWLQVTPAQVTRPGQVTQSKKKMQSCHSHSDGEEDLKIAGVGKPSGTYILYISEFLYDWPEVRFAGKSMGKTQIHYTLIRSVQIIQNRGHLG